MTILSVLIDPLYLISYAEFNDLYMFGWNESGQLAQATNLARPAECFSAVEKLLMACCTMQVLQASFSAGVRHNYEQVIFIFQLNENIYMHIKLHNLHFS